MRKFSFILLIITACSSTKLNESWTNPKYEDYNPKNILVIGVTPDFEVRKTFEFQLVSELNARGINALQSTVVFEKSFQDSKQTEKEIEAQVDLLISKGYDTVLVSLVKGIDDNESYSASSSKTDYHLRHFILYYLAYQDEYFNQDYDRRYKVFNIETSVYNLNRGSEKALVWQGNFDLVDPNSNSKAVTSYINKLIRALEKDKIIARVRNYQ